MDAISRDDIAELLSKYEEMLRMRLEDERHPGGDPRKEMAALASRFPGALRELDETPLEQIRARLAAVSRCVVTGEPPEPWMSATAMFHRLARGALLAKRWLGGRKHVDASATNAFLTWLDGSGGERDARAWAKDLARVASPPGRKLSALVFERVAAGLNLSVHEARALVLRTSPLRPLPPTRGSPA